MLTWSYTITWAFSIAIKPISRNSQEISPKETDISVNNSGELRVVLAEFQRVPVARVIGWPD